MLTMKRWLSTVPVLNSHCDLTRRAGTTASSLLAAAFLLLICLANTAPASEMPVHIGLGGIAPTAEEIGGSYPPYPWCPGCIHSEFGSAVAIRNGVVFAGMPHYLGMGRVAVFNRQTSGWVRTGTIEASDMAAGDHFGGAISFRDNLVVIGSRRAAYIYRQQDGFWYEQQKIVPPASDGTADFGTDIKHQDGVLVIGANNGTAGYVYVYEQNSAGRFVSRGRIAPSVPNILFGSSISMTNRLIVVGSRGTAHVIGRNSNGEWVERQTLAPSVLLRGLYGEDPEFGAPVVIDNDMILVGAPHAVAPGSVLGGIVVGFVPEAGQYKESFTLPTPPNGPEGWRFGESIAMFGNRIAISSYATFSDDESSGQSLVWTYARYGSSVVPLGAAHTRDGPPSVAIANNVLLVGSRLAGDCFMGHGCVGGGGLIDLNRFGALVTHQGTWNRSYSTFQSSAAGYTPLAGPWSVRNGSYVNTTSQAFAVSLANQAVSTRYSIEASVFLSWTGGTGNRGGFVYDYKDYNNYRELTLARSASNKQLLMVTEVSNGRRSVVNSMEADAWRPGGWVRLRLVRDHTSSRIYIGHELQIEIDQTPSTAPNRIGLLSRFNLVRFDDVVLSVGS